MQPSQALFLTSYLFHSLHTLTFSSTDWFEIQRQLLHTDPAHFIMSRVFSTAHTYDLSLWNLQGKETLADMKSCQQISTVCLCHCKKQNFSDHW